MHAKHDENVHLLMQLISIDILRDSVLTMTA